MTRTCEQCGDEFGPRDSREGSDFQRRRYCSQVCTKASLALRKQAEFWQRVERDNETGCWLWTGPLSAHGYGAVRFRSLNTRTAHRTAYILTYGSIPEGMHLDHLCRVRHCVNPRHLEAVEPAENTRRGLKSYAIRSTCKDGHDITDEANVYVSPRGYRTCRSCMRRSQVARAARYRTPGQEPREVGLP